MTRTILAFMAFLLASSGILQAADIFPIFSTNAMWRLFKGTAEASSPDITLWRTNTFVDSNFADAAAPFWYDTTGDTSTRAGGTVLGDMINSYSCIFLRKQFFITNTAVISALQLNANVDDGFVVWINGREVRRVNMPGVAGDPVFINTLATGATEPVPFVVYNLSPTNLLNGTNLIAVQVFNTTLNSSDLDFDADLSAVLTETNPPVIVNIIPPPGTRTNLTSIAVSFSEPVSGVDAGDFLIDGFPADNASGSGTNFTFTFAQPPYGSVQIGWRTVHGITDQAVPPNAFDHTAPSANWFYTLVDVVPPTITNLYPPVNATVQTLAQIEVSFSEDVLNVDAADLRINGQPATNVTHLPGGPFIFHFAPAAAGAVSVAWDSGHGITDLATAPNPFAGGSWSYTVDPNAVAGDLIINEFLANNEIGLIDEDGEQQAWIEIYNRGGSTVNLANWALSDDPDLPGLWSFPARAMAPGEYLVVFASGKDRKAPTGTNRFHTNFKLNGTGEHLGLYSPDSPRVLVHGFNPEYPEQRNDNSYGYDTNGALRYFATPTPGRSNGVSSIVGVVSPVHFGVKRGFFTQPFDLTLSCDTRGVRIRYTTDGREPTELIGALYTAPLRITNTAVLRAAAFRTNYLPSVSVTHTYIFNATAAIKSLPVISLVTASNNLYGPSGIVGISGGTGPPANVWVPLTTNDYHNTDKHGVAWERPLSAELIQPADNSGFQLNCGIRVHGSDYTRPRYQATDKFAYRLYFRGAYGAGKLEYPFFEGSAVQKFDQIILRAGHNDVNPFIRDEMTRRLHNNLGAVTVHGNVVNLFINGQYMGFFNPTERPDENWVSSWYQSDKKWDVIKQFNGVVDGDLVEYSSFNSYLLNQNVTVPATYQEVARRFDLTNFVDYLLLNIYEGMGDWPANNWVAARERSTNGVWRYYVWDGEWGCGIYGRTVTRNTFAESGGGPDDSGLNSTGSADIARYYQRLYASPEFRLLFADRIQKHFFNDGALTDTNISLMHTGLRQVMLPVLPGYDNAIATTWIPARRGVIMGHFNQYGLIASSNAPVFNQFGGGVPSGFSLTMVATNGGGTIYFTTNGGDPRVMFTGAVASDAVVYTGPVALGQSTVVRARTLNGGNWSAVSEARFQVASLGVPLRITELMYNPIGGSLYEFIELQNIGSTPLNLSGMFFEGVTFTFPPNSSLAAGARLVLGSDTDPSAFAARYPGVTVAGYFSLNLNNGGERIALKDPQGNIITSVDYHDAGGWPVAADGAGYSLENINLLGDPDDPANWRASAQLNGTPEGAPAVPGFGSVRLNEVLADNLSAVNHEGTFPDFVELANSSGSPVNIAGWSLTDDGNARKFVFPPGTTINANGYLVIWCDSIATITSGLHSGFSFGSNGGSVFLFDANTNLADAFTYGLQLSDSSVGRVGGAWVLTTPTTNAANVAAAVSTAASVSINEFLANALPGQPDWIELFNNSALPVGLRGTFLSNTSTVHQITSLSFIKPFGFVQLFADEGVGPNHLDFKIDAGGGSIVFYDNSAAEVNRINYGAQTENISRGRLPDGSLTLVNFPGTASPGASNYVASYSGPVLNEVLARNISAVTNAGLVADYVELFNSSGSPFDLSGMSLSVDSFTPGEWIFPPGASIGGGSYLVIWCDDSRAASTNTGDYNTGRALNGESGGVYLFNTLGQLVNSVEYGFQVENRPIGLSGGQWRLMASATPGAANGSVATLGTNSALRVNEWMANPADGADWLELFNGTNQPVDMAGLVLTDDLTATGTNKFRVPPLSFIGAGGFVKWVADADPEQGRNHVSFNLDSDADAIRIYASNGSNIIDTVTFSAQTFGVSQGRLGDGVNNIVSFPGSPTPGESNYRLITEVVINEILTYPIVPFTDTIELRNPTSGDVSIGGWFLSDSVAVLKKFRIPNGTTIPAGGFVQFLESQFNTGGTNAFTLDRARGGELWLSGADFATNLTGFRTRVKFGASSEGVSFGRYEAGGGIDFVAQSALTLGTTNSGPLVGPVVIHEIMYNPLNGLAGATEFIELRNITGTAVDLCDPVRPANVWRLASAVSFSFPPGTNLAAGAYLLVVDFNPADPLALANFRARYNVSPSVPVFGPYTGKLDSGGERLELLKPDLPDGSFIPYVLVDQVTYGSSAPWPSGNVNGGGLTLQRRVAGNYGNDPGNWLAAAPTAGSANFPGGAPPVITQSPANTNVLLSGTLLLQAAATGTGPISWQWRFNGAELPGETNALFFIDYLRNEDAGSYDVYALNSGGAAFSSAAQVLIAEAPYIISAPPSVYGTNAGSNVTFTVIAGGSAPLSYQWKMDGANIPGANTPVLTLTNLVLTDSANYTLTVANTYGVANVAVLLQVLIKPVITNHIVSQTVLQGGTATFTLTAGPNHPLVPLWYRWIRNGGSLPGATTSVPVLVITNVQASGTIRVSVTNAQATAVFSPGPTAGNNVNLTMLADVDGDGIWDSWETNYFGTVNTTNNPANALQDPDGDGMSNRDEYIAGTNPTNALSLLNIVLTATNANVLQFVAQTNVSYSVQWRTNLSSVLWNTLTNITAGTQVRTVQVNSATAPASDQRYFRVVTPSAP